MRINTSCKSEEAIEIMLATAKAGKHPGGKLPLGYKVGGNGKVVPADDESVEIVKCVFVLLFNEFSLQEIADKINNLYLDYNMDNCRCWDTKSIKRILTNPYYKGTQVIGKRRTDAITRQRIYTPKSEWVEVNNHHEAIISELDFYLAQILLGDDTNVKKFLTSNCVHKLIKQVLGNYINKDEFRYAFCEVLRNECCLSYFGIRMLNTFVGKEVFNELIEETKEILRLEN